MSLANKHAVVTGGGSGVGAAVAMALAGAEAKVTIIGRRTEQLAAVASEHAGIETQVCDVTDRDVLDQSLVSARANHGPIDIMVASAGVATSKPFHRLTSQDMNDLMNVNLMGVFNSFQAALGDGRESGWGRLIAIASTAGLPGYPYVSPYCASKHAAVGLVRGLAQELGSSGVTANAICPSYVDTPMTDRTLKNIVAQTGRSHEEALAALTASNPQGRLISPEEIAGTVLWLCSDAAAGINGQAITIDGGEL
jgi:3-hydroxybutyrate dehydrogenase